MERNSLNDAPLLYHYKRNIWLSEESARKEHKLLQHQRESNRRGKSSSCSMFQFSRGTRRKIHKPSKKGGFQEGAMIMKKNELPVLRNWMNNDFLRRLDTLHIKVGSKCAHFHCSTPLGFDDSQIRGTESEDEERLSSGHTQKTQVTADASFSSDRQKTG